MKNTNSLKLLLSGCLFLSATGLSFAQQDVNATQAVPADNTKINQRDRDNSQPTADQQKEAKSDRQIAAEIRRSLVKDKSLSTYAHNVKVIVQDGAVTLKGPVRSDEEKQSVQAKAAEVAGADKITNQIEVAPK
ncbi:MAG: BON domain-containing protein [Acidobacteriota bacterium]|nr:BON domain-containing protein [Acidobacteriota bacterium]